MGFKFFIFQQKQSIIMSRRNNNRNRNKGKGKGGYNNNKNSGFGNKNNNNNNNNNNFGSSTNSTNSSRDVINATLPLDTQYNAAGIIPYRFENGQLYFLLSVERRKDKANNNKNARDYVCILGGPKGQAPNTDANYIITALRQFHEKTGNVVPEQNIQGMMQSCANNTSDKQAALYFDKGKYVLLIYPLIHDLDIADNFQRMRANQSGTRLPQFLTWISVADLYGNSSSQRINNKTVSMYSLVKSLLTNSPTLATYLAELQRQLQSGAPITPGLSSGTPFGTTAATTAVSTTNEQFEEIALQFGKSYYEAFNGNKSALAPFFCDASMFTCSGEPMMGATAILQFLASLNMNMTPEKFECQPMQANGVLLIVAGKISNPPKSFNQTFTLIPRDNTYIVYNMILRDV